MQPLRDQRPHHRERPDADAISQYLKWLLKNHDFLNHLETLKDIGLLEGLQETKSLKFFTRLTEAIEEKATLAGFLAKSYVVPSLESLARDRTPAPVKWFFESGSTVAYLVGHVAIQLRAVLKSKETSTHRTWDDHIVTNNFFGVTAFAGLAKVNPTIGEFDPYYFGFFPFRDSAPHPEDEQTREAECIGFELTRDTLASCNTIFATCSNFSFLSGPLVGGRSNALAKRAIAEGLTRSPKNKAFLLHFHFEKLAALSPENIASPISMRPSSDNCLSVFPLVMSQGAGGMEQMWRSAVSEWLSQHGRSEGEAKAKLRWHSKLFQEGLVPSVVDDFAKSYAAMRDDGFVKKSLTGNTWADFAPHVTIVISLPEDNALRAAGFVCNELAIANQLHRCWETPIRYVAIDPRTLPKGKSLDNPTEAWAEQRVAVVKAQLG